MTREYFVVVGDRKLTRFPMTRAEAATVAHNRQASGETVEIVTIDEYNARQACDVCGTVAKTWEHGTTGGANVSPFRVCAECGGSPRAGVLDYVEIMPGYDPRADVLSYWVTLCDDWVPNGQHVQSASLTREQLLMVRADIDDAIATGDRMRADFGASCAFCRGDEGAPVIGSVSYFRDGQRYAGKVCGTCCEFIVNNEIDAVVVECSHDWYAHSQYPDDYQQCRHCRAVTS